MQFTGLHDRKPKLPFPFSACVIKAYSTENHKTNSRDNSAQQLQTYLNVLEVNGKMQRGIYVNESTEFKQRTSSTCKNVSGTFVETPIEEEQLKEEIAIRAQMNREEYKLSRVKVKSLSPVKKTKITANRRIIASLRYQIVTLYSLLGKREDYINCLKGKADLQSPSLKFGQIEERLSKYEEGKGKDKGRVKFSHSNNEQLRSLKYKPKNVTSPASNKKEEKQKVHYDEESEEEEQVEQKEEVIDFATWKRRNGVHYNQKVFIIKGGYMELRRSLIQRGWFENEDVWSPYYDFKWTTRICDINFLALKNSQGVNHFNNNHHLTSKYGLTRRLRTLPLGFGIDSDRFYPKCFDLGDQVDVQNFVENFKFSFAQSVAKRFLVDKQRYNKLQLKIRTAYNVIKRRALNFHQRINAINKSQFPTITPQQWGILTQTVKMEEEEAAKQLTDIRKAQKQEFDSSNPEDEEAQVYQKIDPKMRGHLAELNSRDPQFQISGMRNVWIAKPNFMSRGRGIRCFNNIYDIADYCLGQPTQFVVQKYIENPLLIEGRKFDIRQWVLIQDFNPPKIWFYQQCYLRFSNLEYSLDDIYNRFTHLTNNSIQKHSKKHNAEKSMWGMGQFSEWLGAEKWAALQEKMKNIVVWSIKSCEGHMIGKKGSAELVGYDFMIDEQLNPWLIEVNMSPSMDYSTSVTKKLVKMVLQDTGLILSGKKNHKVGNFTCIYRGNQDLPSYNLYNI